MLLSGSASVTASVSSWRDGRMLLSVDGEWELGGVRRNAEF